MIEAKSHYRRRYRRLIDAISDGIFMIDRDYRIIAINRAAAALVGLCPAEVVDRPCYRLFRGAAAPCPDCGVAGCFADGQPRRRLRVTSFADQSRRLNIFFHPAVDNRVGACSETVVFLQDATDVAVLDEDVLRAEKMACLGQVAAGIAHELNNFLTSIYGIAQLLQLKKSSGSMPVEKEMHLLDRLVGQIESLNLLTGNLMGFTHPEQEMYQVVDLNRIVDDALDLGRYELEREAVRVRKHADPAIPEARLKKSQVQQVVLNLMLNAVHAVRKKKHDHAAAGTDYAGEIVVRTGSPASGWVCLQVEDDGCGIEAGLGEMIFTPFFSSPRREHDRKAGGGLGLATVKNIVADHGGNIEWRSEPGEGTVFTVNLPVDGAAGVRGGRHE
ncbi:MAG: PAS domain-containing protein [Deltaproteobacteria bacterium]|nr:PAS domain-containing protein [Candidatus Anaeroferrophillacea bacterium]